MRLFRKLFQKIEPGQIWVEEPNNPFDKGLATVIESRNGYVRYRYMGVTLSSEKRTFRILYSPLSTNHNEPEETEAHYELGAYCPKCGVPCQLIIIPGDYDTKTGERRYKLRMRCPNKRWFLDRHMSKMDGNLSPWGYCEHVYTAEDLEELGVTVQDV
jgi:hypothetical protein